MGGDQAARLRERIQPGETRIWSLAAFGGVPPGRVFARDLAGALAGSPWEVVCGRKVPLRSGRIVLLDAGGGRKVRRSFLRGTDTWVFLVEGRRGGLSTAFALFEGMREAGEREVWIVLFAVPGAEVATQAVRRMGEVIGVPYRIRPLGFYQEDAPGTFRLAAEAREHFFGRKGP